MAGVEWAREGYGGVRGGPGRPFALTSVGSLQEFYFLWIKKKC